MLLDCAFGALKQRAWRIKDGHGSIKKNNHATPGSIVVIDQLVSAQLGLLLQASGYLSASRIWACNMFLDLCSGFGYGHMMCNAFLDQTVKAKQVYFVLILAMRNNTVSLNWADLVSKLSESSSTSNMSTSNF